MRGPVQKVAIGAFAVALAACSSAASPPAVAPSTGTAASAGTAPSTAPSAAAVTITFEHQFGDAESAKFDQLVKQYEADNPGVTIKTIRDNDSSYYDKLVTAFLADSAPDIVRVEPPRAAQFIAAGYAGPLEAVVSAADQTQFFPGTIAPLQKDGKLFGVPQDVATLVLYYRTDLFKAANISGPPTTWEDLLADAQKLTKAPGQYGLGLFGGWGGFEFYPWLWQAGGEMLDASNKTVTFNDAGGVKALQFWADLENKHKVMPLGAATLTEDDYKGPFVDGKLAMFTSGPWNAGWLKGAGISGKWAAAPLPKDVNDASVLGGMDIIVNAKSQHQAEAAKFLTWLLTDSVQIDWASSLGFVPIKQSMYSDPKFSSDPLNAIFLAELKVSRSRPTIAQAGQLDDLLGKAVQAALSGAAAPKAALDDAAQKAQQLLK
jgi:multiple sugar transport system substrate-binding protein